MAGVLLFEKIIQICQQKYGCSRDVDFPYVFLMNYPFGDMLTCERESDLIENQLEECFYCLFKNSVSVIAIACNTLHAFLPLQKETFYLVHMIEETGNFVREKGWENPIVLCTSTSAEARLHEQFFPCRYPKPSVQKEIDALIDRILAGGCLQTLANTFQALCEDRPVIFGCTELSLLNEKATLGLKNLCDPNSVVAEKMCEIIFNKREYL